MTQPQPDRNPAPYRTGSHADPLSRREVLDDPLVARREGGPAAGPFVFLPLLALFVVGLWLMGNGYERDSALFFTAGLLVSGIAFAIPLTFLRD